MNRRNLIGTAVLVVLLGILGRVGYSRGFRLFFDAPATTLASPYTTEEAWIVDEIVRDIAEMSSRSTTDVAPTIRAAAQPGTYTVTGASFASPASVNLQDDLWSPTAFAVVARPLLSATPPPSAAALDAPQVHQALLDLTATTLVTMNDAVSQRLRADLRDPSAHEAAALVLGAFALREPVGRQSDTRWAMNRMTAHLAMAAALRAAGATSVDGQLAEAVLHTLKGHQRRALATLDRLHAASIGDATAAWDRAVRLRITDDWRVLAAPKAASRLEQREYFRARLATVRVAASSELDLLDRPMEIDWFRIVNGVSAGGEDVHMITSALDMERAELDDVYRRIHGRALIEDETNALNTPATRCLTDSGVQVLPWGAWAEFAQRRTAAIISRTDSHLRHGHGDGPAADTAKVHMHETLGQLWTFPSATIWWTKGPRGLEADNQYLNEAITEGVARPHRLTARAWAFMEFGSRYEPVRKKMAPAAAWFFATAPRTAYEATLRLESETLAPAQALEAIVAEAPYDYPLAAAYLTRKYGEKAPLDELVRLAGPRLQYDTRAITAAIDLASDGEQRVSLLETACAVSAGQCQELGLELAKRGRDADAARAYERALADPSIHESAKATWSGWLVRYYHSRGQIAPALRLAERSAGSGMEVGRTTAGRLYERLDRLDDAERAFRANLQSYESPAELIAFYYRALNVRKLAEYETAFARELERVFPNGLTEAGPASGPPTVGVFIEKDSRDARAVGLQAGDVIVAVDGWTVENMVQYRTVRAIPLDGPVVLTVARGGTRSVVRIADRAFVPDFRIADYPVRGWIEK